VQVQPTLDHSLPGIPAGGPAQPPAVEPFGRRSVHFIRDYVISTQNALSGVWMTRPPAARPTAAYSPAALHLARSIQPSTSRTAGLESALVWPPAAKAAQLIWLAGLQSKSRS
jgi:hypothetical protein